MVRSMNHHIEKLFPFSIVIDESMMIVRIGRSAKKLLPEIKLGNLFSSFFTILRPRFEMSFHALRSLEDTLFVVQHNEVQLKGQMNFLEDENTILFVFTPIVRDVSFFKQFNITMNDFPFYDNTLEFLFALQAANKGLEEARLLSKNFEDKVDQRTHQLQQKNEEMQAQNEIFTQQQFQLNKQSEFLADKNRKLQKARELIHLKNRELKKYSFNLEKEVRQRTEALTALNRELKEQNNQLEQFAFIVAHNLRAPIARILGLINLMKLQSLITDDSEFYIDGIHTAAQRLEEVIKDLNRILEIRSGLNEAYEMISLEQKTKGVLELLNSQISDSKASLSYDFTPAPLVYSISSYVENILFNLISNAIKYRHSERRPLIVISSHIFQDELCLTVSDNGIGFDIESNKANLFGLYKRFHDHVEGKGLGLYMIKTQTEAIGGKIEVESTLGVGTTFRIFFKTRF
jgi:signal transduction histidine kinase